MTFATVPRLLKESARSFTENEQAQIDLAQVSEADSAGLALLIEWKRLVREKNGAVMFTNIPAQLIAIARISEVDEFIDATTEGTPAPSGAG